MFFTPVKSLVPANSLMMAFISSKLLRRARKSNGAPEDQARIFPWMTVVRSSIKFGLEREHWL